MPKRVAAVGYYERQRRRRKSIRPTCVDVFGGAGGLAEGFQQAGFEIVSSVDADAHACATFKTNFPNASVFHGEIGDVDGTHLLADSGLRRGELDCLIGGPPCQSFSYNNHQRSAKHARAKLFHDYLRLVDALHPKCIVMENVPGILTIDGGRVVASIKSELEKLGYHCEARILYAEDFGVPQERRRVFFIGTRCGWRWKLFPQGTHGPAPKPQITAKSYVHHWKPPKGGRMKPLTTIWDAIGDLPLLRNGTSRVVSKHSRKARTQFQRQMRAYSGDGVANHTCSTLSELQVGRVKHVPQGGNWRDIPRELLPAGMKRAKLTDHTKRYGRLHKRALSGTLLTKCDPHWGAYIHPTVDRTITPREAARIQSFRDGFRFLGPLDAQYMQVGNAVPPLLAKAIGKQIRAHVNDHRFRLVARRIATAKRRQGAPSVVVAGSIQRADSMPSQARVAA